MTSMAEQLGYGDPIELATGAAWLHELRDAHGEWTRTPGDKPGTGLDRYKVPPHERLINPRADYPDPADMPFFKKHPVSADNVIAAYDAVPKQMRPDGMHWYHDAHLLSKALAHGNAEEGAILLANYSPQANWPINMFRAARVADEGKPIRAGDGYVTNDQVKKAQKALDGLPIDQVLISPKTRSFAHLLAQGDDSPDDPYGHVVIDAHALNVAAGGDIRGATYHSDKTRKKIPPEDQPPIGSDVRAHEYVGDTYRQAAKYISERDGVLIKPHQMQAVTWVAQVLANQAEDRAAMEGAQGGVLGRAKGRLSARAKDWQRWLAYAKAHNMQLIPGVSALAAEALFAQVLEMAGEDSIIAQLAEPPPFSSPTNLAYDSHEPRDDKGRWTKAGGRISPPGTTIAPGVKQLRFPGMPEPVLRGPEKVRRSLEKAIGSDGEVDAKPGENVTFETPGNNYFGNTADTDIVSFEDGSTWVRKRSIPEDSMHREIAYSRVSDVLGAGAPEVIERQDPQTGRPSIWMPYVDGQTAIEWTDGYDPEEAEESTAYEEYDDEGAYIGQRENTSGHEPGDMYYTQRGMLIGLADTITNVGDRHMGNWMIEHGQPVPIDNESASIGYGAGSGTPFAEALAEAIDGEGGYEPDRWKDPAQWDEWMAGLQGLEGEFDDLGMREQWQHLLLNFKETREMVGV